jgi:hypothetical protein
MTASTPIDRPTGGFEWTKQLRAQLPIVRGIHVPEFKLSDNPLVGPPDFSIQPPSGDTPRIGGCGSEAAQQFDALALLDADNGFEPNHLEILAGVQRQSGAHVVTCARCLAREAIHFPAPVRRGPGAVKSGAGAPCREGSRPFTPARFTLSGRASARGARPASRRRARRRCRARAPPAARRR